jgi:hypothetical protein
MPETQDTSTKEALTNAYSKLIEIDNLAETLLRSTKCRDLSSGSQPDRYVIEVLAKSIAELTQKVSEQV